jgi:hypothetical protein
MIIQFKNERGLISYTIKWIFMLDVPGSGQGISGTGNETPKRQRSVRNPSVEP